MNSPDHTYYLPASSTIADIWKNNSESQDIYAELCVRGHRLIANQIIEARNANKDVSIQDLLKTGAKVRRAIAVLNNTSSPYVFSYGFPYTDPDDKPLGEPIFSSDGKFSGFFPHCLREFSKLESIAMHGTIKDYCGADYSAQLIRRKNSTHIKIRNEHLNTDIAEISHVTVGPRAPVIYLKHVPPSQYAIIHAEANKHFQRILTGRKEPHAYAHDMSQIDLHLFHAPALRLGSQTNTLMVLAGIHAAMGYEIIPRQTQSDHFIDAEFNYLDYANGYSRGFIRPHKTPTPPTQSFEVDTQFLTDATERTREEFSSILHPVNRLEAYIEAAQGKEGFSAPIKSITVADGRLSAVMQNPGQQPYMDNVIDFIGDAEIIQSLALPEGKFAGPSKWQRMIRKAGGHLRQR